MEDVIYYLMDDLHKSYRFKAKYEKRDNVKMVGIISKRIDNFEKAISILEKAENNTRVEVIR